MDTQKLKDQIKNLGPWYQTIDFNGVPTNKFCATGTSEQVYQDIRSFLPESLMTMSFLDIGCSAAYFIVRLMMDGAANAVGIDVNPKSIEQAEFTKAFFLNRIQNIDTQVFCQKYEDYIESRPHNARYEAIIASSVIYPRFIKPKMDKEWMEEHFYKRAELLANKTYTIIARWRQENNCRNGDIFYEQLKKFKFHETGRKELCSRTLVRYQRKNNLKLLKNHDMVFNDNRTRGFDEIINAIAGCRNMRVWHRLDKATRRDLSPFITYLHPDTLTHRAFNSPAAQSLYNTKTQLEFLTNHKPQLLASIKKNGIDAPPIVRKDMKGDLLVDDGNHRVGIAQSLKFNKIAVIILEECEDYN